MRIILRCDKIRKAAVVFGKAKEIRQNIRCPDDACKTAGTAELKKGIDRSLIYRGMPREERRRLAQEALVSVGLEKRMDHRPGEMSGGQQQRVAIARAVAAKPPIIMADEPTGNLDSASGLDIMRKLTALNEQGTSIILITHDNHLAQMAKRIVTIQDGRIISDMKGGAV